MPVPFLGMPTRSVNELGGQDSKPKKEELEWLKKLLGGLTMNPVDLLGRAMYGKPSVTQDFYNAYGAPMAGSLKKNLGAIVQNPNMPFSYALGSGAPQQVAPQAMAPTIQQEMMQKQVPPPTMPQPQMPQTPQMGGMPMPAPQPQVPPAVPQAPAINAGMNPDIMNQMLRQGGQQQGQEEMTPEAWMARMQQFMPQERERSGWETGLSALAKILMTTGMEMNRPGMGIQQAMETMQREQGQGEKNQQFEDAKRIQLLGMLPGYLEATRKAQGQGQQKLSPHIVMGPDGRPQVMPYPVQFAPKEKEVNRNLQQGIYKAYQEGNMEEVQALMLLEKYLKDKGGEGKEEKGETTVPFYTQEKLTHGQRVPKGSIIKPQSDLMQLSGQGQGTKEGTWVQEENTKEIKYITGDEYQRWLKAHGR